MQDWVHDQQCLAETEQRMVAVLDALELTTLVTSIHGISAVGAAAILAETGDPRRFATRPGVGQARGPGATRELSCTYTGPTN
jgi:transposase